MNGYDNTNSIFRSEQDLDNVQLNTFGNYRMSAGLSDVHSTTGQKIGEIKSVVTNSETRIIDYVVFQFDRIYGLGEKNYFLPWNKFHTEDPSKILILPVDLETLTDAPFYHQNHWPDDIGLYLKDVNEYWDRN